MPEPSTRRYRFGPLERRGLVGSLRSNQVLILGLGLVAAVLLLRILPPGPGMFSGVAIVLGTMGVCFWPVAGRSTEEWLPIVGRHTSRRARGRNREISISPQVGVQRNGDGRPAPAVWLPNPVSGIEILAAPLRGEQVGVAKDSRHRTYTASLAVRVTSFGLLDRSEQEARQAAWGSVLATLAREGSPVGRIQWLERTVPADGDEIGRYLADSWDRQTVSVDSVPMQSYLDLTNAAPAATKDHELLVSLQIDLKRAWRQVKRAGGKEGPDAAACEVLLRELEALGERLGAADLRVVGALRPGMLARTIRTAFDPWCRPGLARLGAADPQRDGIEEGAAWPLATDVSWSNYRADGAFHATYWIAGWPRTEVGAAFLSPLLLHTQLVRSIAVTIEPISPVRAVREVEAARTTDLADRELRGRLGFMETARRRQVSEATLRREEELADGHAAVRFAGYVTVSARDERELEHGCSEIEHAAQMARLELLRLYGQQDEAFTYTLPLCRGLR
jgi:hypothetical protein